MAALACDWMRNFRFFFCNHWMKFDRKQVLNFFYQVCVLRTNSYQHVYQSKWRSSGARLWAFGPLVWWYILRITWLTNKQGTAEYVVECFNPQPGNPTINTRIYDINSKPHYILGHNHIHVFRRLFPPNIYMYMYSPYSTLFLHNLTGFFGSREKEGDLTHSYDKKNPYTNRKFENQWTTQKRHQNFVFTTIADRLRAVSWSHN